jgi:SAM-dependent methyltransferase
MSEQKGGTQAPQSAPAGGPPSQVQCPLCKHTESSVLETLATSTLKKRYHKEFGVEIDTQGVREIALRLCAICGLKFYVPRLSDDERFYGQMQKAPGYYIDDKSEYHIARDYVRATDDVLEIGAGRGQFGALIECRSYLGLEFSPDAIAAAEQAGIRLLHESVQDHARLHANQYDVVCSFQVLEHVSDPGDFLAAAVTCLRPGGRLIVGVPSDDGFIGASPNIILNMPPHHASRWTDQCLANVAGLFDLSVVAIVHEKLAEHHVEPYTAAIAQNALRKTLHMEQTTLDARLYAAPVRILLRALNRPLSQGLTDPRMRPDGHTVAAIYEKRSVGAVKS